MMGMRYLLLLTGLVMGVMAVVGASPLSAQQQGRFAMKDIPGGFAKLDTKTGTVTECRRVRRKWECTVLAETVPEPSAPKVAEKKPEDDIKFKLLERDNIRLKSRVAELEVKLKKAEEEKSKELRLPDDKDIDKMMGFIEKLFQRFMDFARQAPGEGGERT